MDRITRTYGLLTGRYIHGMPSLSITGQPCEYYDFLVSYYNSFDREELGLHSFGHFDEEADTAIDYAYRNFEDVGNSWKKGMIGDEQLIISFYNLFDKYYTKTLHSGSYSDLRFGLSELRDSLDQDGLFGPKDALVRRTARGMWSRFTDDYNLWRSGGSPCSLIGDPWLSYKDFEGPAAGFFRGDEVSPAIKEQFFKMMDAFCLSFSYYLPYPSDMILNHTRYAHHPMCTRIGFDIWEDDGGLLSKGFQLGSTVTLTDCYGLKSVIKILDHQTSHEDVEEKRYYAHAFNDYWGFTRCHESFFGYGHIEGYTSTKDREIDIAVVDGRIFSLYTVMLDEGDLNAAYSFPLWEEHNSFKGFLRAKQREAIRRLTFRFIGDEATKLWGADGHPAYYSEGSSTSTSESTSE